MNINLTDVAYFILLYTACSTAIMAILFKAFGAKSYMAVYQNILICIIFIWYQPFHMVKHCFRMWKNYRLPRVA